MHLNRPFRKYWWRLPQWVPPDSRVRSTRAPTTPSPGRIQAPVLAGLGLLQPT